MFTFMESIPPEIIVKARAARGLKQSDVAERLGMNPTQYARYERGKTIPRPDVVRKLRQILYIGLSSELKVMLGDEEHTSRLEYNPLEYYTVQWGQPGWYPLIDTNCTKRAAKAFYELLYKRFVAQLPEDERQSFISNHIPSSPLWSISPYEPSEYVTMLSTITFYRNKVGLWDTEPYNPVFKLESSLKIIMGAVTHIATITYEAETGWIPMYSDAPGNTENSSGTMSFGGWWPAQNNGTSVRLWIIFTTIMHLKLVEAAEPELRAVLKSRLPAGGSWGLLENWKEIDITPLPNELVLFKNEHNEWDCNPETIWTQNHVHALVNPGVAGN